MSTQSNEGMPDSISVDLVDAIDKQLKFYENYKPGLIFWTDEKSFTKKKQENKDSGKIFPNLDENAKKIMRAYQALPSISTTKPEKNTITIQNTTFILAQMSSPFNTFNVNNPEVTGNQKLLYYWWYQFKLEEYKDSTISISIFVGYYKHENVDFTNVPPSVTVSIQNNIKKSLPYTKKIFEKFKNNNSNNYPDRTIKKDNNNANKLYEVILESFGKLVKGYKELIEADSLLKNKIDSVFQSGRKQIVLTGAPGTGKTFTAREYASEMIEMELIKELEGKSDEDKNKKLDEAKKERIKFVQFHPSFDYTDFVEGLKPVQLKDDTYNFVRVDGVFKAFCRTIEEENNKEKTYYFIIDEINRADLSKVFGELMYGLEESYRGKGEYQPQSQYSYLPTYRCENGEWKIIDDDVFKEGFYIPENLRIIGTMNDIDRSVEAFDFALRRRFRWIEVTASEVMKDVLMGMKIIPEKYIKNAVASIDKMNEVISGEEGKKFRLSKSFHIGPAYFKALKCDNNGNFNWDEVFDNEIEPILREYIRPYDLSKQDDFISKCKTALVSESANKSKDNSLVESEETLEE